jgi:hypothetical protein
VNPLAEALEIDVLIAIVEVRRRLRRARGGHLVVADFDAALTEERKAGAELAMAKSLRDADDVGQGACDARTADLRNRCAGASGDDDDCGSASSRSR